MGEPLFLDRKYIDPVIARRLYEQGYCDQQIADRLGIARETVKEWRRRNDLPGHKRLFKEEVVEVKHVSTLNELAAEAKRLGMTYGQYMVARKEGKL